ncbi:SDR family oxidoreductase [Vineibacter terrae]|uniref:SDR family oxidoreductase n=2 Tax=Vineibacter terrae TaxID=2586908 RepID=A0A5C8PEH0_9HYPH|nr:SDR family oxidoreductase [Vineibacter terrae]
MPAVGAPVIGAPSRLANPFAGAIMDLGLKGQRVLVTGGSKSIGRAIVDTFVAEGATVGFCARDAALVQQREVAWKEAGGKVTGTALDVTDEPALKAWIDGFAAANGGLDHFVANVSALGIEDSAEGWRRSIEIDLVSTVNALRLVRPHLEKSAPGGSITVIGTVSLVEVSGPTQPYRSVKAALVPLVKSLAVDLAPKGVRVNMVSPGTILEDGNTWGRQRDANSERYQRMLARNPMGRMGRPDEVADAVAFLSSRRASFVSGANFIVDGAVTSRVQY